MTGWLMTCQGSGVQKKEWWHYHGLGICVSPHCAFFFNSHLLFKHTCDDLPCYSKCIYDNDNVGEKNYNNDDDSREKGLTLGTQSICAVLSGLTVPFAHFASVSGYWGVAFPSSLPLTLTAAHCPLAPLIPASINYNIGM